MADIHLGYRQYNLDQREEDIYNAFDQAIDKVLEERADVLILSGDILEDKTKVIAILGDHDIPKRRGMNPLSLFELNLFDKFSLEHLEIDGVLFAGISTIKIQKEYLKDELKKFDQISKNYKHSVLILHQGIKEDLPFEGAHELFLDDLPKSASYYALGHIHARKYQKFGNGYLAYSGSLEILGKDEVNSWKKNGKGFYIVDLNDDIQINEINLDIRPQYIQEVNEKDLDNFLSNFSLDKNAILHMVIKGINLNKLDIIKRINEKNLKEKIFYYRLAFEDKKTEPGPLPTNGFNLKEIFDEYFKDENISNLAFGIYNLLKDKKPKEKNLDDVINYLIEKGDLKDTIDFLEQCMNKQE